VATNIYATSDSGYFGTNATYTEYLSARNAVSAIDVFHYPTRATVGQLQYSEVYDSTYNIMRLALIFNTSSIPEGAIITAVRLNIYCTVVGSDVAYNVVIQNGQPTYPSVPLVAGDFDQAHYSGDGGSRSASDFHNSTWGYIDFNETGMGWINKGGVTKLLLRSSRDIASQAPTYVSETVFPERIRFYLNQSSYIPYLSVTYTAAAITTEAVTNITDYMCAMGHGTIVAGEPTERGFEVKVYVDFFGVGAEIWWNLIGFEDEGEIVYHSFGQRTGYLIKRETWTGEFEPGAYEGVLGKEGIFGDPDYSFNDALEPGYAYKCRAYMVIDGEYYYGDWVDFDTIAPSPDDYPPTDDISDGNPIVPIIPIEPFPPFEWEMPEPELPPFILPDLPDWEFPDYPPMSFVGDFYYKKPYTKKDLDDLRKKCIIYNKNSIEFALVLRHNMNVLREFFNMMTDYMDKEEFNDFTDLIPPQRLKELYLDPLTPTDFRDMINEFIRNTIDNNMAVNRNFKLINEATTDPQENSEEGTFKEINSNIKTVIADDPDVHRL